MCFGKDGKSPDHSMISVTMAFTKDPTMLLLISFGSSALSGIAITASVVFWHELKRRSVKGGILRYSLGRLEEM